jgi:hypothetical protein
MIRRYLKRDGILWFKDDNKYRIFVPKLIRRTIISAAHDDGPPIHNNWEQTAERITRHYHWPSLHRDVQNYVRHCDPCQRNKINRRMPFGLLEPHRIPESHWDTISMDFIGPLQVTRNNFDTITVVVDSASKRVRLDPSKQTDTARNVAKRFEQTIWRDHGLPRHIISDHDTRFVSAFWTHLMKSLRIKQIISMSYHPQTDGQTEIKNAWVTQALKYFVNYYQNDWDEYLHIVKHAINDSQNSMMGYTPFYLDTG